MNKHDNIYNILGKLASLEPQPPKQESMLKQLNESSAAGLAAPSVAERLTQKYQEAKQLNEYFTFDMPKGKDRGPRDTGTDELDRRSKLGKDPLIKHGAEYKQKDRYGNSYKISGPKGRLPEGAGQEGPADLLAAVEQEINNPGRSIDNLIDVLNATFGSDRSPEFKKARAVIGKYIDLVDNAAMGSEEDGIAPMRGGNIARHIQQYDLTDYLQHAAAMLDKVIGGRRPVESASMPGDQYLSIPADQTKLSLGQQMARDGITHNGNEQEMIGQIAKYMKDRGDSSRTIRYYMNDNDFVADTLSDLRDASSQKPDYKSKMQDKFGGDAAELTKGLKIRNKHDKYDESVEVDEDMLAKRDYDGDGKKESGEDEYMGSRDRAIKKAMSTKKIKEGEDDVVPGKSWVKDPSDPASKVPAYQRKANEPGRQAAQDRADASNAKVGAKVFRSGRTAPMEEEQYDENDAHSSLPGMRKTSDKEHSEYDAAAHTIRKWMRKRGWNTNEEFKPALKYIMDNLEDKHDDSLTDEVKEAAQVCEKHHSAVVEAGLDMNLLQKAQGAMQGANTDPESERNRGKKYGYRSDRDDTGNDDDYDEYGNEKKGAKKSAPGDEPKKKGRPKKNFGPERTTSKAWKHKGQRVSEAINLETYVEDTMLELETMFIIEKAKSKSQQRFFGMVHAAKKGDKPASKEVAKAAKGMSKKDAEDFAKTKHKGLPEKTKKKTNEGVNFAEMVRETGQTIEEMLMELNMEMEDFRKTGRMGDKLRDALDLHRHSRALMDGAPADSNDDSDDNLDRFFHNPDVPDDEQLPPLPKEVNLDELALLAGLHGGQKKLDKNKDGKLSAMDFAMLRGDAKPIEEGGCNMTAEGVYCEVHGMNECGTMYESKDKKPDFLDLDDDGNKKEPMADADNEDEDLKECGPMGMTGSMESRDGMNINTSIDTNTGRKSISVSAEGEAAEELAKMLKMAGMVGAAPEKVRPEIELGEYANEPEEQYAPVSSMLRTGNDLHKSKIQDPGTANRAANPLEEELAAMYKRIKDRS